MFLRYIIGSDRTLLDRLAGLGDITYLFLETHIPRTNNYFKKITTIITWNPQPFPLERRQPMGSFGILGPSAAGDATGFGFLSPSAAGDAHGQTLGGFALWRRGDPWA